MTELRATEDKNCYDSHMPRHQGSVAIVTGGASGIGLATARQLAREGATVVIGDIQDASAVTDELNGLFVETDVADADAAERLVTKTVDAYGRLDILFNNAGIEAHGPLAGMDLAAHRRIIDINLHGVYHCMQSAIRAMMQNAGPTRGAIVNTSSIAGLTGVPMMSSYNAAKAAVVMLTRNAAVEYGQYGVRINAICPGIIRTPMAAIADNYEVIASKTHALRRIGEPEEVAKVVSFLVSDEASFVTGTALPVDGGALAGFQVPAI